MTNDGEAAQREWTEFLESTPAYVERRFENLIETFDNISRVLKDDETLKAAVTQLQDS